MSEINQNVLSDNQRLGEVLDSLLSDITNTRAEVVKLVADIATLKTAFDTAITKLNSDGGVSDTNYAGCTTLTAADPAALGTTS